MHLHADLILLVAIIGGVTFMLSTRLLTVRMSPDGVSRWSLMFLICAEVFLGCRFAQRTTTDTDLAALASRLQYGVAMLLAVIGVIALRRLLELELWPPIVRALCVASGLFLVLTVGTDLVLRGARLRTDILGHSYWAPGPGPCLALGAPVLALIGASLYLSLRRSTATNRALIRRFAVVGGVFCLLGANDTLQSAGVIQTMHLLEFGFVGVLFVSAYQQEARLHAYNLRLVDAVATRTSELEHQRASLERSLAANVRAEHRLRALAEASQEGVVFARDATIVDANAAAERLLRRSVAELREMAIGDLFARADRRAVEDLLACGGGPLTLTATRKGSDSFRAEISVPPRDDHATVTALLLRDITVEADLRQRLLQADRLAALGTLAAGTAHEINNPLAYIIANAELLAELVQGLGPDLPAELVEAPDLLHDVLAGSHRVRTVVLDLVNLAREPRGDRGPAQLPAVLDLALQMAGHELRHRAEVIREIPAELPLVVGGPSQLGQVFLNLLVNAAQAIPHGSAADNTVRVAARVDGAEVVVEITDTGGGIDPAIRDRLFDPFFTTKGVGQGTGLGLSICHGVVTGVGGSIAIDGELGRGTSVTVRLLIAPDQADPTTPIPTRPLAPGPRGRILIVDDDPPVARALRRTLSHHDTTVVGDGAEALRRLTDETFDVIVCDLMMPNVSGMEVHARLAARDPALAARMLFVTGGVFTDDAAAFLATLPGRWFGKPVDGAALRGAIAHLLEGAAA
jgi:signal transduction histidine kinase/CheY-like chemotaxis protein